MWFTNNHRYNTQRVSGAFLGVVLLTGLFLLTTACGGGSAVSSNNSGNVGVLFNAPPTSPLQVRLGNNDPAERIVCFRLSLSTMRLKKSVDPLAASDLLSDPTDVEFTRLADITEPVAVPDVTKDTYDQLEVVVTGARVTFLDSTGQLRTQDIVANLTRSLTLSPSVTIGDTPTLFDINVDVAQTVQLDLVNNVASLNTPVISAAQYNITAPQSPAPSGFHSAKPLDASNPTSGKLERIVGNVVATSSNGFSLQLAQSKSVLVLQTDSNTVFNNATLDTLNGMLVSVEGWTLTSGALYADEVEALFPATGVEVEGTLAGLNPSGLQNLVPTDGIGAGMTSSLVGAKISVNLDGGASYAVNTGNEDMTGLPVVFDETHISAGQNVEAESYQSLQADWAGNPAQVQPYMVELLRQTVNGTVSGYVAGTGGAAEFDLILSANSYVGIMNAGAGTIHVYQRSTTEIDSKLSGGIADGQSLRVRGFMFCSDPADSVPPGTTYFAMVASSITKNN
jgi:hypothetical protein